MGAYDDITPEQLRSRLVRFARLVLKLEERGELLERSPAVMKLMGELRRMLFAWEVRGTARLGRTGDDEAGRGDEEPVADEEEDVDFDDSLRIVREALDRERELQDELRDRLFPDDD